MSRSTLAVAGVLVVLGLLTWFLTPGRDAPAVGMAVPAKVEPVVAAPPSRDIVQPRRAGTLPVIGSPPRIATRAELAQALNARGLDGEKLIAGYRDWRVARGFLDADPLAGISAEDAPSQVYATMDRVTQKSLADSGDLGAIQAYAAGSLPGDPLTAVKYYGRASELGSAAAMLEVASLLADVGGLQPEGGPNDRAGADKLLALRGGNPNRDLRQDSAAWALAAIRQYGPILATPASMDRVGEVEVNPDTSVAASVCGQSLAILASLSAATAGKDSAALPPVFLTEKNVYDRLPCRDTPAPVTPPRALEACTSSPAIGGNDQAVLLWICPEN